MNREAGTRSCSPLDQPRSLLHRPSSTSVSGLWHSQHQTSRWLWRWEGRVEQVGSRGREEEAQLGPHLLCLIPQEIEGWGGKNWAG